MLFILGRKNISNVKSIVISKESICNSRIECQVNRNNQELICNQYFINVTYNLWYK